MRCRSFTFDTSRVHIEAKCPFCTGTFSSGFTKEDSEPFVMHSDPACFKFLKLEPDAFLRAARLRGCVVTSGGPDLS
jgi:hypothetical protein